MRTLFLVWLLLSVSVPLACAQIVDDSDVKPKIIALEQALKLHACRAKDMKTLDALLDDHFVHVDIDGNLQSKPDLMAFIQSADSILFLTDAMDVRLHGDTAIVTGLYTVKGVVHGKAFLRKGRFIDTWQLKDAKWILLANVSMPAP